MKPYSIYHEEHALLRLIERSLRVGLDVFEAKQRVEDTIRQGLHSPKHRSKRYITSYRYFNDNLSFFVIWKKKEHKEEIIASVKTVIIEEGRP